MSSNLQIVTPKHTFTPSLHLVGSTCYEELFMTTQYFVGVGGRIMLFFMLILLRLSIARKKVQCCSAGTCVCYQSGHASPSHPLSHTLRLPLLLRLCQMFDSLLVCVFCRSYLSPNGNFSTSLWTKGATFTALHGLTSLLFFFQSSTCAFSGVFRPFCTRRYNWWRIMHHAFGRSHKLAFSTTGETRHQHHTKVPRFFRVQRLGWKEIYHTKMSEFFFIDRPEFTSLRTTVLHYSTTEL